MLSADFLFKKWCWKWNSVATEKHWACPIKDELEIFFTMFSEILMLALLQKAKDGWMGHTVLLWGLAAPQAILPLQWLCDMLSPGCWPQALPPCTHAFLREGTGLGEFYPSASLCCTREECSQNRNLAPIPFLPPLDAEVFSLWRVGGNLAGGEGALCRAVGVNLQVHGCRIVPSITHIKYF